MTCSRCRRRCAPRRPPEAAGARAIREELGELVRVRILGGEAEPRVEELESASYPGLPARYVLYAVDPVEEEQHTMAGNT